MAFHMWIPLDIVGCADSGPRIVAAELLGDSSTSQGFPSAFMQATTDSGDEQARRGLGGAIDVANMTGP